MSPLAGVIVCLSVLAAAGWLLRAGLAPIGSVGMAMARPASARRRISALRRRVYAVGLPRSRRFFAIAAVLLAAGVLGATSLTRAQNGGEKPAADGKQQTAPSAGDYEIAGHIYLFDFDQAGKQDERPAKSPLAKVPITLYLARGPLDPLEKIAETTTDEKGHFQFAHLVPPRVDMHFDPQQYGMVVRPPGRPGAISLLHWGNDPKNLEILLDRSAKSASLTGRLIDQKGKPIPGATIDSGAGGVWGHTIPGFESAVTDKNGHFQIDNLSVGWPHREGYTFRGAHPDYPATQLAVPRLPAKTTFTLRAGCTLTGTVVDEVTGRPAAGALVSAESMSIVTDDAWARTDKAGRYRLVVNEGYYNILAEAENRAGIALVDQQCVDGQSLELPPIKLTALGWIEGQVIDSATSKPIAESIDRDEGSGHELKMPVMLGLFGPSYPLRQHDKQQYYSTVVLATADSQGRFKLPAPAGNNYPYLSNIAGRRGMFDTLDQPPVVVKAGETTRYDMFIDPIPTSEDKMKAARDFLAGLPKDREARIAAIATALDDNATTWDAVETWFSLLRELYEMGPDAVPQISQALDNTNKSGALRSFAFVLRAIGDPRAVPALIRAIPRTLRRPESDMGYEIEDDELAAFMSKYDEGDRLAGTHFIDFNRPVREVFLTLKALTGRELEDQILLSMWRNEDPNGLVLQQPIFHREAERWQTWWEANWERFTKDRAYSKVNLPPDEPLAVRATLSLGPDAKLSEEHWEEILSPPAASGDHLLDLDTGLKPVWPADVPREETAAAQADLDLWAAKNGADLMCVTYRGADGKPTYALRGLGTRLWEISRHDAETIPSSLKTGKLPQSHPAGDLLLHHDEKTGRYDPEANAAFLYVTREGGIGLIQVTDRVTVQVPDEPYSKPARGAGEHLGVRLLYRRIIP